MKIQDLVISTTVEDVATAFESIAEQYRELRAWIITNKQRTNERVVLENLCEHFAVHTTRLSHWVGEPIDMVAWATRNLYELYLQTQFIFLSEDNLLHWVHQRAQDEVEICEGMISLDKTHTQAQLLEARIKELEGVAQKNGYELKKYKSIPTNELARKVGMGEEHTAFFKLYSKYVHPSSWFINAAPKHTAGMDMRNIFWIQAQLYSLQGLNVISQHVGHGSESE